ncbi:MAG: alpha/beta fold hydrolase [Pseudomonadota bacterium]
MKMFVTPRMEITSLAYNSRQRPKSKPQRIKGLAFVSWLVCCTLIAALSPTASAWAQRANEVFITAHVQILPGESPIEAERGFFFAPENRGHDNSRLIAVSFLRFPSTSENPGPPVFWLPGGPGDSALRRFVEGSFDPRFINELKMMLADMRAAGDVIMMDQRGAGLSAPFLMCAKAAAPIPPEQPLTRNLQFEIEKKAASECKQEWRARGHDTDGYHITELADDVKALKDVLGYEQIILFGGSFGSQWSLSIMRRHPDMVARALLRGIEDTNDTFDAPQGMLSAIKGVLKDSENDPDIAPLIPEKGFLAAIQKRIAALEDNPQVVTIKDPNTGEDIDVAFGAEELRATWWRDPDGWRIGERLGGLKWPGSLAKVVNGDYEDLARMTLYAKTNRTASMRWPAAMSTAVDCGLAGPDEIYNSYARDPATRLIGDPNIGLAGGCAGWAAKQPPAQFFDPLQTKTPVLFIHGVFDMATPYENAVNTIAGFENGRLITIERSGHNPLTDVYREDPDSLRPIIRRFLRTGSHDGVPGKITLPPLDYKGPRTAQ